MNIKEAKEEILHTIQIYTRKDAHGQYLMPSVRQRPVLLIGPPGIGKTAIMEQISRECGIGLTAYTITHHTRQSAVGLPVIVKKNYQGKEYSITEYTMSEIIASVYETIEKSGCQEGILFIDEINCVSETLVPTMLQFLQNKTFGTHPVPEGWVIVAAGNPVEYNKSAREFDIVTLDRVKRIDVEPDLAVWKEYAWAKGIHPAILSYLSLHNDRFYHVENTASGVRFVTARGWEDLSSILYGYEDLDLTPDADLVLQYLQEPETARDFAGYYDLYAKYRQDYRIPELLSGRISEEEFQDRCNLVQQASTDEKISVVGLLLDGWNSFFQQFQKEDQFTTALHDTLKQIRAALLREETLDEIIIQRKQTLKVKLENHLISSADYEQNEQITKILESCLVETRKKRVNDPQKNLAILRDALSDEVDNRKNLAAQTSLALENGYRFASEAFEDGPELLFLTSDLSHNPKAVQFISTFGCEPYFHYSEQLMFQEKRQTLLRKIERHS